MTSEASQLIKNNWITVYEERLERLWFQSVRLNANLYLLEKIARFPVSLFALDQRLFWSLSTQALYESCIMVIGRIVGDKRKDVLTLTKFRDELLDHALDKSAKDILEKRLTTVEFDEEVNDTIAKAVRIRNEWFAHLKREATSKTRNSGEGAVIIPLDPLLAVRDAINRLIDTLTLDIGRSHIYPEYSGMINHPIDMDSRPDIDKIFDMIVEDSEVLRMPETQAEYWHGLWKHLSEHEKAEFNRYRLRHDLVEYIAET